MATIRLTGRITEAGELKVELPTGMPPGEVRVTIEISTDDRPWSLDELEDLLKVEPMTGAQIVEAGLLGRWGDRGIINSSEWVEEQRRKRKAQREW